MSTKGFSLAFIAVTLAILAVVGLFNRIVDPYWYFREVEIVGFNHVKPHAVGNERLVKPALVNKLSPDVIILGNSVAEIGLPPTHRGLTNDGTLSGYNLALPGASWTEVYCLAMFVMRQTAVKRLIIGTAGEILGEVTEACPTDAALSRPDYAKLLFSRTAITASRETLQRQNSPEVMTREGLWYFHRFDNYAKSDEEMIAVIRKHSCQVAPGRETKFDPARLSKEPVSAREGANLRELIRLARSRRIELVFLFYPTHVLMSEFHRSCYGAESQWNEIWRVVSIVQEEDAGSQVQVWDFSSYVPLNAERVFDGRPGRDRLWQEILHFNEKVGGAAMDSIYFGNSGYGDRVTVRNFDDLVARREADRNRFLIENPWLRQDLDVIARRLATNSPALTD